ncbi:hypothetical protein KY284_019607 [Solanum tuberosum]|nr:hypothetical protein KY284_019607 [Solanum tuberosum]
MSLIYPLIKRKIKASAIFSECNFNFQNSKYQPFLEEALQVVLATSLQRW